MAHSTVSGKSPYATGNSSRRGRGVMLVITVVILLCAVLAWTTVYTRAVASPPNQQPTAIKDAAPDRH